MAPTVTEEVTVETNVILNLHVAFSKNIKLAILQLAAVQFDVSTGETLSVFERHISYSSCIEIGLRIDQDILRWPEQELPNTLDQSEVSLISLPEALADFTSWANTRCGFHQLEPRAPSRLVVWGNGGTADNAWLRSAYSACDVTKPHDLANNRCIQTILKECLRVRKKDYSSIPVVEGLQTHQATRECKHQIACLIKALNDLYGGTSAIGNPEVGSSTPSSAFISGIPAPTGTAVEQSEIEHAPKRQRTGPPAYTLKRGSELISSYP